MKSASATASSIDGATCRFSRIRSVLPGGNRPCAWNCSAFGQQALVRLPRRVGVDVGEPDLEAGVGERLGDAATHVSRPHLGDLVDLHVDASLLAEAGSGHANHPTTGRAGLRAAAPADVRCPSMTVPSPTRPRGARGDGLWPAHPGHAGCFSFTCPEGDGTDDRRSVHGRELADRGRDAPVREHGLPRRADPGRRSGGVGEAPAAGARIGFTEVDPTDTWVRVGDLDAGRLEEFRGVLADVGLTSPRSPRPAGA